MRVGCPRLGLIPVTAGNRLQMVAVVLPPRRVHGCHVVVAVPVSDAAVGQLTHNVCMTGMPMRFGSYMDQYARESDRVACLSETAP